MAQSTCQQVIEKLLCGDREDVRKRLIASEHRQHTALHMACSRSNEHAVKELLKYIQGMFILMLCVTLHGLGPLPQYTQYSWTGDNHH